MELRWLILSLFFTKSLADENSTNTLQYEWNSDNPYWSDEIKPCADEWMPMCYEEVEGEGTVPILCECGQDHYENDFLIAFAQCLGKQAPDKIESGFMGLQWDCSEERLSVNMTKREFTRIAEGGEVYPTTSSGLSTGAIAGVVVGAVVGGAAVIGLLIWLWFQRRRKNGNKLESNPPSSPKPENSSTWATEFKPEWTANAPVELPPTNYAGVELPPESAPIYEMDAMSTKPIEMQGSIPEDVKKEEEKGEKMEEVKREKKEETEVDKDSQII
ncbi:c2h2 type zinc finger containing [Fusarium sporotrichioides]|uniref:C2h2 type zinc finger containing n=1 Tax=Fusarium sporotrichioides TaxID=5514 RepID=A0A395SCS2_FUSSP|nr:c2h2 type zinc finger containing [Fusarium sporotrichioides]